MPQNWFEIYPGNLIDLSEFYRVRYVMSIDVGFYNLTFYRRADDRTTVIEGIDDKTLIEIRNALIEANQFKYMGG